jgi:hypothetical protein
MKTEKLTRDERQIAVKFQQLSPEARKRILNELNYQLTAQRKRAARRDAR